MKYVISYINGFRYSFDENEIRKRYPDIRHKDIFKPFEFDEK